MKVGYLGPQESYSHLAAKRMSGKEDELIPFQNFTKVINSLIGGVTDGVVIPIENSLNGGVLQNLDLLQSSDDIYAVKELVLPIDHRLFIMQGATLNDVKRVYSHEQAIGQCNAFLTEYFSDKDVIAVDSTSKSVSMVQTKEDACIAGSHIVREGLVMSGENIANVKSNFTHFLLVKKGVETLPKTCDKIFFTVVCKHEPGALLRILSIISAFDLNMTKIESRPIKDKHGEYSFFIEMEANIADMRAKHVISLLNEASDRFRLLGCY